MFRASRRLLHLSYQEFVPSTPTSSLPPFVISHGMLGNRKNWTTVGRDLAKTTKRKVYSLDLRNHGESPHSDEMNYGVMAEDVVEFCSQYGIGKAICIGHSMGGKVAMTIALTQPDIVHQLIVVDVTPRPSPRFEWITNILLAMRDIDLAKVKDRKDADEKLKGKIETESLRQFVLTNLRRNASGTYEWAVNVSVLLNSRPQLFGYPLFSTKFAKESLFIGGLKPNSIETDRDHILELFPRAGIEFLNTGHFVHHEDPEGFVKLVNAFISQ